MTLSRRFLLYTKCTFQLFLGKQILTEQVFTYPRYKPLGSTGKRRCVRETFKVGFLPQQGKERQIDSTFRARPGIPGKRILTLGAHDRTQCLFNALWFTLG
jgi:hypothetical protein